MVHAGNRHVCDAPDTGVITHERQKIEPTLFLRRAVGNPAAIGPCLFDMGAHRSVVEFNPRYRPPGLDTASLQSVKYRCKEIKLEKKRRKLTAVTMQPSNGLIEIDEPLLPPSCQCKSIAHHVTAVRAVNHIGICPTQGCRAARAALLWPGEDDRNTNGRGSR